jgi:phosphatidylserine/phosphatidylglycerophosphate/cardiolipin synthase-like enzyme
MQTLKIQLLERLKPLNEVLSVISRLLWLIVFALIIYVASIYVYKQFQNTSSVSCSLNFTSHDCYQKLIQKIHKAKHFILIQQPNMLKGNDGKNVLNALKEAENRKISIKYISDKNLIKYHYPLFDNEARFWIDTKPKSYEEIKSSEQIIYVNGVRKQGLIYSILFD